jgi:hypothetical protein
MKIKLTLFSVLTFLMLSQCAGPYYSSDPSKFQYKTLHNTEQFEYYMIDDVLAKSKNKRFAKKEKKQGLRMMAVKIKNITDSSIILSETNLKIDQPQENYSVIPPAHFYDKTKKNTSLYLIWGLAFFTYGKTEINTNAYGTPSADFTTVIVPIGIPIAIINMLISDKANKNYKKNLEQYNLLGKTLNPGEEVYGFVFIDNPHKKD